MVKTEITKELLNGVKEEMPELAHEKVKKFVSKHKIKQEDAHIISACFGKLNNLAHWIYSELCKPDDNIK